MPKNSLKAKLEAFAKLLEVMDELREKCPWDRKQTFDTIRPLTIEEVFELSEAILNKDFDEIKKEIGDLLLHVVFYAKMGDEINKFDIKDIIDALVDKLIFRHPHVFGDAKVNSVDEVKENWEKLKLKEKKENEKKSVFAGIPKSLSPMIKAYRLTEKASHVGFDWDKKEDIWGKLDEEINELMQEVKNNNQERIEQELGDVLFVLINAARLYGIDPEKALDKVNKKFIRRFEYVEKKMNEQNLTWDDVDIKFMDKYWDEAKKLEKK